MAEPKPEKQTPAQDPGPDAEPGTIGSRIEPKQNPDAKPTDAGIEKTGPGKSGSPSQDSPSELGKESDPDSAMDRRIKEGLSAKPDLPETAAPLVPPVDQCILTVQVKRLRIFGVGKEPVFILQNDAVIEHAVTDHKGEAVFKLAPGEYRVKVKERRIPISLQKHAILRF